MIPSLAAPTPDTSIKPRAYIELFPNLIINVNRMDRSKYYSSGYTAEMSAELSTLFSFDIPYDISPTCNLKFELPAPGGLFVNVVEGSGQLIVIPINGVFTTPTSYGTVAPLFGQPYGTFTVSPGGGVAGFDGSTVVPCSPGSTFQVVFFSCE